MNKHFFLLQIFSLLSFYLIYAQNNVEEISISHGESITKNLFSSSDLQHANWIIKKISTQEEISRGDGEALREFIFENSGNYQIDFSIPTHENHDGACNHIDLPNSISLSVSNQRIDYLVDQCEFSNDLNGGVDATGIMLSIPVEITSLNNTDVTIPSLVYAKGVDANLIGSLNDSLKVLPNGNHILYYNLTGTVSKDTYVSFDFEDLNGNIISYYHQSKIK